MRKISKKPIPPVLQNSATQWTNEFKNDPTNNTKKYRYRNAEIKGRLLEETSNKCVYCESKVGHNTPGDVEHKVPTSADKNKHFEWDNLTIACAECNRRKLDYFDSVKPFLDPYLDDVESRVKHLGPLASWMPGDSCAEITIKILEMHDKTRSELLTRKIETIEKLNNVVARMSSETGVMQEIMMLSIEKMKSKESEYSGMVCAVCETYNIDTKTPFGRFPLPV